MGVGEDGSWKRWELGKTEVGEDRSWGILKFYIPIQCAGLLILTLLYHVATETTNSVNTQT